MSYHFERYEPSAIDIYTTMQSWGMQPNFIITGNMINTNFNPDNIVSLTITSTPYHNRVMFNRVITSPKNFNATWENNKTLSINAGWFLLFVGQDTPPAPIPASADWYLIDNKLKKLAYGIGGVVYHKNLNIQGGTITILNQQTTGGGSSGGGTITTTGGNGGTDIGVGISGGTITDMFSTLTSNPILLVAVIFVLIKLLGGLKR